MLSVKAPGKLMLSGEWSVLEQKAPCVVLAVDKYVTVSLNEGTGIVVDARNLNISGAKAHFDGNHLVFLNKLTNEEENKLVFAKEAIETALRYQTERGKRIKGFHLSIESEITKLKLKDYSTSKVGFGSSASVVVGIVAALLRMYGQEIDSLYAKKIIYKLSCIAHYLAQSKVGSGFDVASSVYGDVIVYKRFDPKWLTDQIRLGKNLRDIIKTRWENFQVKQLTLPKDFTFCVGFCGYQSSTKSLVLKMEKFKERDREKYDKIVGNIRVITENLIQGIIRNDKNRILRLLERNRSQLKKLGETSGIDLETKELNEMIEIANGLGAAAKFSGAGGGDCVVAVCFDKENKENIESAWRERNFSPIGVGISKRGVHVVSYE